MLQNLFSLNHESTTTKKVARREERAHQNFRTRTWGPANVGVYTWTQPNLCSNIWNQTREGTCWGCIHLDPALAQYHHPSSVLKLGVYIWTQPSCKESESLFERESLFNWSTWSTGLQGCLWIPRNIMMILLVVTSLCSEEECNYSKEF